MEDNPDFLEINIADFRKIDDIRSIIERMRYMPSSLKRKVYIFDEVHQLTPDAQQVLLKVFEEPRPNLLIFMCTTQTKGIDRALLDRAEKVSFRPLDLSDANTIIDQVLKDTGQSLSAEVRASVFDGCDGSVRALLNNLQAVLDGEELATVVEDELDDDVKELAGLLLAIPGSWSDVAQVLKRGSVRSKPETIRIGVESYVRQIVINRGADKRALHVLTCFVGTLSTEPLISQYNRLVFKCIKAHQG